MNMILQEKKGYNRMKRMKRNKRNRTRKVNGGMRIGLMNPTRGGRCGCLNIPKLPIPLGNLQKGGYIGLKPKLKKTRNKKSDK